MVTDSATLGKLNELFVASFSSQGKESGSSRSPAHLHCSLLHGPDPPEHGNKYGAVL
jgi:hypothetical protein